jgi:hypothetical protein
MANPFCVKCQRLCQQPDFVVVVRCPLFEPVMQEDEFFEELTHVDEELTRLRRRTSLLLTELSQGHGERKGDE